MLVSRLVVTGITDMGGAIEHASHFSQSAVLTFFLFTSDGRVDRSIHAVHVTITDIPFTDFGNDSLIKVEGIDTHGHRQEGMGGLIGVRLAAMSNSRLPMHTHILVT